MKGRSHDTAQSRTKRRMSSRDSDNRTTTSRPSRSQRLARLTSDSEISFRWRILPSTDMLYYFIYWCNSVCRRYPWVEDELCFTRASSCAPIAFPGLRPVGHEHEVLPTTFVPTHKVIYLSFVRIAMAHSSDGSMLERRLVPKTRLIAHELTGVIGHRQKWA